MCELLGLNSGRPVRPSAALAAFRSRGGQDADNADGWGIAYLADGVFRLEKAPEAAATSTRFTQLASTVDSELIVAHVRKARHPPVPGMLNTHPFTHACCGREWVFAHNGMVPEVMAHAPQQVVCTPAGETDSEHAFCHLLGAIASCYEGGPECGWMGRLEQQAGSISLLGKFNFLLSDGDVLVAYGHDRLHYLEDAGGPHDLALVATEPLTAEGWRPFAPGELRVYRAGRLALRLLATSEPRPLLRVEAGA